jgi:hypothetical protein
LLLAAAETNFGGHFFLLLRRGCFPDRIFVSQQCALSIGLWICRRNPGASCGQKKRPDATEEASGPEAYFVR